MGISFSIATSGCTKDTLDEAQAHCVYLNIFSNMEECREYRGSAWTLESGQDDCNGQQESTFAEGSCPYSESLGYCLFEDGQDDFYHVVFPGSEAEACANSIGAHSLLCRVGAYYHDIGKMQKSEYFIENQFGGDNKHNKITATMSARIIRAHVKEGLKLAKEYGLPKIVSDFIPMHHGTTRVEYFYRMALEQAKQDKTVVDESAFRYPGPKPNTKETGILMLCEAIEAAVRSIKEPDILKIETMIDKIINQRIEDGQLSECPLTLDELRKIKGTVDGTSGMLPVLRGIYHIRVEYPDDAKSQ